MGPPELLPPELLPPELPPPLLEGEDKAAEVDPLAAAEVVLAASPKAMRRAQTIRMVDFAKFMDGEIC